MNRWTEDEISILKENFRMSLKKEILLLIPNHSYYSIRNQARKLGLKQDGLIKNRMYRINFNYFNNFNTDTCYWAGFIAADGSVDPQRGNIQISLSIRDESQIIAFAKAIEYDGPIKYKTSADPKGKVHDMCYLAITGARSIVSDLGKYNIVQNKTLILKPPVGLSRENELAYIIGYIDGDGCISYRNHRDKTDIPYLEIRGTEDMLNWIKNIFDDISDYTYNNRRASVVTKGFPKYGIEGKRALEIINYLLSVPVTYRMARKWDKFICQN